VTAASPPAERRALVVGYTWVDGEVRLRSWPEDDARGPLLTEALPRVAFRVEPGKWCTGHNDGKVLVRCPDRAPATRGSTCEACGLRDEFRPCLTCDGFRCPRLSPDMTAYCRQHHHLYLACFGDEDIKVGTASDPRKHQRLVEQGPLAAARVAEAAGPRIRQMETLLAQAGFTETVRRTRKTALLAGAMTEVEARNLVLDANHRLKEVLPREYHGALHAPIFVPQPELARRSRSLPLNPLELEDGVVVEGEVVGAVGHTLFVRDADGTFALDLGALKGRRVTWDPAGPRRKPTAQLGLF
jgi:hypothetical protein